MRWLDHGDGRDPWRNLALEEYCVRRLAEQAPFVLLYVNRPAVVIGKNQNPLEEVNLSRLRHHGLPLVRRISGGGTVVHDEGNLNFCFVWPHRVGRPVRFDTDVAPVVRALRGIGAEVEVGKRHDLRVADGKISGNAQFATVRARLSHGTLLFDADLERLRDVLRVDRDDVRSRSVKSVRSEVTNLRPLLGAGFDLERFRNALLRGIVGPDLESTRVELPPGGRDEVLDLAETKYRTWEWSFGRTPPFELHRRGALGGREVAVVVQCRGFRIERLEWPAAAPEGADEVERALLGTPCEPEALRKALLGAGAFGDDPAGRVEAWSGLLLGNG